jgi:endonuclease YncB( thermonuclease family)
VDIGKTRAGSFAIASGIKEIQIMARPTSLGFALSLLFASPAFANSVEGRALVVDGDTIDIDGTRIRLHGIDAPEAGQRCNKANGVEWRCGQSAVKALVRLVQGKTVKCDHLIDDGMGRMVASCHVAGADVSAQLVRTGNAWAFVRYSRDYVSLEEQARAKGIGIWQGTAQPAWEYRADRWRVEVQTAPKNCPIKGNVSDRGRIYHAPWSPWYSKTRVNVSQGDRWFCTEAEAVAAGFRAPLWN